MKEIIIYPATISLSRCLIFIMGMRIIKLIMGVGCLILALYFSLGAIAFLISDSFFTAIVFAIPGPLFGIVGWLLIFNRKTPMSMKGKAAVATLALVLVCF